MTDQSPHLTPQDTARIREAVVDGIKQVPGYMPGPLAGPIVGAVTPVILDLIAQALGQEEEARNLAAVHEAADRAAAAVQVPSGTYRAEAYAIDSYDRTPTEGVFDGTPEGRYGVRVTGSGGQVVEVIEGTEDRDALLDVLDSPGAYVADQGAVRISLHIVPSGWNEGFEMARAPVLTFFVPTIAKAAQIRDIVDRHPSGAQWTDHEVRLPPASGQAEMTEPSKVATTMQKWLDAGGLDRYTP